MVWHHAALSSFVLTGHANTRCATWTRSPACLRANRRLPVLSGQTRYVNKLESRTGTLWEGRFKASLIDTTSYLLACCRYVDLNPVRAAMVASPDEYSWSSYRSHVGISDDQLLDPSSAYRALGKTNTERSQAYRAFVAMDSDESELATVRTALQRNQPTGSRRFCDAIGERIGRRISTHGPGRPSVEK